MFKNILLICCFGILGFVITVGIFFFLLRQGISVISPLGETHFSLEKAPVDSLIGNIASISGEVLWQSRIASSPSPITRPQSIQQGETILTGASGSATVGFNKVVQIILSPKTTINVIQTLPINLVFQQTQGTADYTKISSDSTVSIRGLDLLINLDNGYANISVDKAKSVVIASLKQGFITATYTDINNISQIIHVSVGSVLKFNNNTREAAITSL